MKVCESDTQNLKCADERGIATVLYTFGCSLQCNLYYSENSYWYVGMLVCWYVGKVRWCWKMLEAYWYGRIESEAIIEGVLTAVSLLLIFQAT